MAIIYKITNLLNNKIYIGQSVYNNKNYFGSGKRIKNSIKKYGKINFRKEILEECDLNKLDEKEIYWIDFYKSCEMGYNISTGGKNYDNYGKTHSDETLKKLSEMNKGEKNRFYGKHHSDETKRKISESLKTSEKFQKSIKNEERINKLKISSSKRIQSDETKKKISDSNKGKKRSQEMKNRMSEIQKKLKPFGGKKHNEKTKQKISETHKGKIVSLETREKMKNNNIGKKLSNETKQKMCMSHQKIVYKIINDIIIQEWKSPMDVCNDINLTPKKVQYYCRKKDKTNRYNLIYKDDYDKNNI